MTSTDSNQQREKESKNVLEVPLISLRVLYKYVKILIDSTKNEDGKRNKQDIRVTMFHECNSSQRLFYGFFTNQDVKNGSVFV